MALKSRRILILGFLAAASQASLADDHSIAFVDVTLIAMTDNHLLPHQTVVTRKGIIVAIGPADLATIPTGAQVIDGRNRFLMPGLTDMHMHFLRPPNPGKKQDLDFARYHEFNKLIAVLNVANGVTTVRNMYGHSEIDKLIDQIRSRIVLGPTVYSTGPITDGNPPSIIGVRVVTTADAAAAAVHYDKIHGYVGLKPYDRLTLEAYEALVRSARAEHLPIMGHLPLAVPLDVAIESQQASIEHAESFQADLQADRSAVEDKTDAQLFAQADFKKMEEFGKRMRGAGVWTCPTIVDYQMEWPSERVAPEMQYMPREILDAYRRHYAGFTFAPSDVEIAYGIGVVRALHSAGAGLLAGTDAFKPNDVPGFALHRELNYFVEAGLSPYEALRAATSDPATFLGRQREFGTIRVGRRADLLLLYSNPLDDIHNLAERVGVMVRGKWFEQANLQRRLDRMSAELSH